MAAKREPNTTGTGDRRCSGSDIAAMAAPTIGRGANRRCVVDPGDSRYCLKYELPDGERTPAGLRARLRRWLGRRFPRYGDNATELRAWRWLQRRLGADRLAGRFAACHGVVATDDGPALRCECIRLADGTSAPSLHAVLFDPSFGSRYSGDALSAAVDDFEAFLLEHGIPLFDLNAGNFVVVPEGDGVRLVCVDAKSVLAGKEVVPLSRWVPALGRRKVRRRAGRLRERVVAAMAARTSPL